MSLRTSCPLLAFVLVLFPITDGLYGLSLPPEVMAVLKGHSDTIEAVAISPDGKLIATASFDKTLRLFDASTGKEVRVYGGEQGHKGQVLSVDFSAKGDQIATGGSDNFARIWEVPTSFPAARFATITACAGTLSALLHVGQHLPETKRLAVLARLTPTTPSKSLQHPNLVDAVAFDRTGTLLATGCHDGVLRIWDIAKGNTTKTINAHVQTVPMQAQHPIYSVLWSPDQKQIFTSSYDKTIKLWDVANGNLVREFKAAPDPQPSLPKKEEKNEEIKKVTKVDSTLAVPFLGSLVKSDPPLQPGPPGHSDQVFTMALTQDGKYLATGSSDRTIKLWEVATGRVIREFPNPDLKPVLPGETAPSHPGWVQSVRITPDGQYLVSAGPAPRGKGYLAVWKVLDGERLFGAECDFGPIHSLAITPDGKRLVIGSAPIRGKADADAGIIKLPEIKRGSSKDK